MDLAGYLEYAGSVARTATLLQAGFTSSRIRTAVAAGEIRRLRHGVVALPGARADFVAAVLANGTLSAPPPRRSTAYGASMSPNGCTCCAHTDQRAGAVIHRASLVPPEFPQPVASLTDTLLHALRCLPPLNAAVMVESALLQGRTTLDYLGSGCRETGTGPPAASWSWSTARRIRRSRSLPRLLFRSQGIYTQTQVQLPGIGIVDFLLEGFLIVEIDGSTHLERAQVRKDRGRNNASTLAGYAVLRYGYQDVVYNPQKVIDEVRQVLRGRVIR